MISDNNHITYSAEDIKRYWDGRLSPQEMHAMEKAALDDPFLADAIEGYGLAMQEYDEKKLTAEQGHLHKQLESRVSAKTNTAPVRSFRWWQAAAAAIVLVVAGYWILSNNKSEAPTGLAHKENAHVATTAPSLHKDTNAAVADEKKADTSYRSPEATGANTPGRANNEAAKAVEPGYYKFNTSAKKDSISSLSFSPIENKPSLQRLPLPPVDLKKEEKDQPALAKSNPPVAKNVFDSVREIETQVIEARQKQSEVAGAIERNADKEQKLQNIVSGVVTDNRNNPLPNVFIRLDNTKSFTTDLRGNFQIPIQDSVANVSVSLPGYATQNFQLRSTHNGAGNLADNKIELQPASEMTDPVVNGYYSKKNAVRSKENPLVRQAAQPVTGWPLFDQYLDSNKRRPASNPHLTGEVAVSFEVNKKGERSNYKVEKSLSAPHDAEALRLIVEGPAWKLLRSRKSRVTVIVRF